MIQTLGELRKWLEAHKNIPNETAISTNFEGMEGTGDFTLKYYEGTSQIYGIITEIWIEDA